MKQTGVCPKCHVRDVLRVEVTDQVEESLVGLAQEAYICGSCSYIEFYARDPATLRSIARVVSKGSSTPFR
jgi:predicted nucleic-acid-binding Zn-ribbon protein